MNAIMKLLKKETRNESLKFGGNSSVGTVERMKHVATLIKDATPKIVVLSATAGTTNHLEEIAANLFNREIEQAHDRITRLEFQFIEFANGLLTDEKLKREAIDYILDRFQQLWKFTKDSFTSVEEKEVLAQGELISTALMHFYLRELKVPNDCFVHSTSCVSAPTTGKPTWNI